MIDPTGATIRFRRFVLPILTALSLFVLSASLPETRAGDGEAKFVGTWFLVRLTAPVVATAEASMPLTTGRQALDDSILESGVTGIERVFRSSGRSPRNREVASRHGLDRTYRFHVPAGSDICSSSRPSPGFPKSSSPSRTTSERAVRPFPTIRDSVASTRMINPPTPTSTARRPGISRSARTSSSPCSTPASIPTTRTSWASCSRASTS